MDSLAYLLGIAAAAGCFIGLIVARAYGWPWWSYTLLAVGLLVSFFGALAAEEWDS